MKTRSRNYTTGIAGIAGKVVTSLLIVAGGRRSSPL